MWPQASIRSSGYLRTGAKGECGEGTADDGGLIPSQTYKDLVACEDNTAVLTSTGDNPGRVSYKPAGWQLRGGNRRIRGAK